MKEIPPTDIKDVSDPKGREDHNSSILKIVLKDQNETNKEVANYLESKSSQVEKTTLYQLLSSLTQGSNIREISKDLGILLKKDAEVQEVLTKDMLIKLADHTQGLGDRSTFKSAFGALYGNKFLKSLIAGDSFLKLLNAIDEKAQKLVDEDQRLLNDKSNERLKKRAIIQDKGKLADFDELTENILETVKSKAETSSQEMSSIKKYISVLEKSVINFISHEITEEIFPDIRSRLEGLQAGLQKKVVIKLSNEHPMSEIRDWNIIDEEKLNGNYKENKEIEEALKKMSKIFDSVYQRVLAAQPKLLSDGANSSAEATGGSWETDWVVPIQEKLEELSVQASNMVKAYEAKREGYKSEKMKKYAIPESIDVSLAKDS